MSRHEQPSIRSAQRAALRELQAAVSRADWAIPCNSSPSWISDDERDQAQAAELCAGCPVIIACRNYINQYPREQGVYAGTTFNERNSIARPNSPSWIPGTDPDRHGPGNSSC